MKKLKLETDELRVETFAVDVRAADTRGTVQAHAVATLPVQDCFRSLFPTCGIYC